MIARRRWATCATRSPAPTNRKKRSRAPPRRRAPRADNAAPLSIDGRAEGVGYLRDALAGTDKPEEAKQVAEQLRTLLGEALGKAATRQRAVARPWPRRARG